MVLKERFFRLINKPKSRSSPIIICIDKVFTRNPLSINVVAQTIVNFFK